MSDFDTTPEERAALDAFIERQLRATLPSVERGEVTDLSGKTAIVTAADTGLGLGCARQLRNQGITRLILAVRDQDRGFLARAELLGEPVYYTDDGHVHPPPAPLCECVARAQDRHDPDDYDYPIDPRGDSSPPPLIYEIQGIEVWDLDLASYESIKAFAVRAAWGFERLDIFVNTADVANKDFVRNPATGHEQMVQVNYLSLVLLTLLMLPTLRGDPAPPGRLFHVHPDRAPGAKFEFQGLNGPPASLFAELDDESKFDGADRYYTTKVLAGLFFAELSKKFSPAVGVLNPQGPGPCHSGMRRGFRGFCRGVFDRLFHRMDDIGARTPTEEAMKQHIESHRQTSEDDEIQRMAPLNHIPQGAKLAEQLWNETMQELKPFGVEHIIESLRKR